MRQTEPRECGEVGIEEHPQPLAVFELDLEQSSTRSRCLPRTRSTACASSVAALAAARRFRRPRRLSLIRRRVAKRLLEPKNLQNDMHHEYREQTEDHEHQETDTRGMIAITFGASLRTLEL